MKSKVYFIRVDNSNDRQDIKQKFFRLLNVSGLLNFIRKGDKVAIKMHFGEEGNTGYVRPEYVRVACENILERQASCFLSDTNTLYRGKRMNSQDHLKLSYEHGFTRDNCAADVVIPDETRKENCAQIYINQKFIKTAKVVKLFLQADALLGIAHFKGHIMTGFGGALKNIGMGCATREGKLAQHSDISPYVIVQKCIACGECIKACPQDTIFLKNKKAYIDPAKCIGCASCIAACLQNAIEVNWEAGGSNMQEKMIEYTKAVLQDKQDKSAFINFAIKITKECDCLAKDDPRIVPDVGIFASRDPVSIDKASLDLVNKQAGKDLFKEAHPTRDWSRQLKYAYTLGLGNLEYDLIELSSIYH
jgi:uncharacterized Fe-S center protein